MTQKQNFASCRYRGRLDQCWRERGEQQPNAADGVFDKVERVPRDCSHFMRSSNVQGSGDPKEDEDTAGCLVAKNLPLAVGTRNSCWAELEVVAPIKIEANLLLMK